MAKDRGEKHRYGQHYTPTSVARLLAELSVRSATDIILDPACGDGRLLAAALSMKKSFLSANRPTGDALAKDMFGLDRTSSAIPDALNTGAMVACADFFDTEPGSEVKRAFTLPATFDAVIGNPPYIRHEIIGGKDKRRIEERLDEGRALSPELFWPQWSRRSDIYVYFFAHAARFLKSGGRLVFLTASSWLDSRYGAPLREFMVKNFRVIAIIESAAESFFTNASINTAITLLEREPDASKRDLNHARFITLLRPLDKILLSDSQKDSYKISELIDIDGSDHIAGIYRVRSVEQTKLKSESFRHESAKRKSKIEFTADANWSKYLRADDIFFEILKLGGERLKSLSSFAGVRFGVKTGANEFFYVKDANGRKAKNEWLSLGHIASIRRGLTTGANEFFYLKAAQSDINHKTNERNHSSMISSVDLQEVMLVEDGAGEQHLLESAYLSPVIFSLKEIDSIVIESVMMRRFFFNCHSSPDQLMHSHALKYIDSGERAGYHQRPTCAGRNPWYATARGMMPAPLIFPAKVGERWIVALNRAGVYEDKKLYGIFPHNNVSNLVLAALLNSTWARYYTEVTCRQMTGAQAIADIDVNVAEGILIPDPRRLNSNIKKSLESALMKMAQRPIRSVFEEINLSDRRALDELTVEAMGITKAHERREVIDKLYAAVTSLVKTRLLRKVIQ